MPSHQLDFSIHGDDMQFVEIELDPGETVIAEAGAMMYLEEGITFETRMGDGSEPDQGMWGKLRRREAGPHRRVAVHDALHQPGLRPQEGGLRRALPREDHPHRPGRARRAAHLPEGLVPLRRAGHPSRHRLQPKLGAGFFGGEGFILQDLQGDGKVFVHAGGTVVEKQLAGEMLAVDTGCLVAFQPSVQYDIQRAGNLKSMVFGGEGLFLATLRGAGKVWLQSLPFSRLADRIAPMGGGSGKDEGSVIGGLSSIFER